jgi:hypothetical protein
MGYAPDWCKQMHQIGAIVMLLKALNFQAPNARDCARLVQADASFFL